MIKKILLVLLLIVVAVAGYLYTRLDSLVKKAVETYGPRLTQTSVTLDGIGAPHGVDPKDAVHAVLAALTRSAVSAVQSSGVGRNVQQGIQNVQKQLKGLKGLFHK